MPQESGSERNEVTALARGVRLDLVIAVCALLVSSLATAASWWQTRVIQQQLSAQVWPYISVSSGLNGDTMQVSVENDGLGPAVVRSASIRVDGKVRSGFIDSMHAILGPNVSGRVPHGEKLGLTLSSVSPGSVLRVGEPIVMFSLTSKRFTPTLVRGFADRVDTRICYCAIVPGTCWIADTKLSSDPAPVSECPEIPNDLLHESVDPVLNRQY